MKLNIKSRRIWRKIKKERHALFRDELLLDIAEHGHLSEHGSLGLGRGPESLVDDGRQHLAQVAHDDVADEDDAQRGVDLSEAVGVAVVLDARQHDGHRHLRK